MSVSMEVKKAALKALEVDGEVTAERVFEAARHPNHPLHSEFVWDGNEAVHQLGLVSYHS